MKCKLRCFIWFIFLLCLWASFTGCLKAVFFYTASNVDAKTIWLYSDKEKYLSEWYLYRVLLESVAPSFDSANVSKADVSEFSDFEKVSTDQISVKTEPVVVEKKKEKTSSAQSSIKEDHTIFSYYYYEGLSSELQDGYIMVYNGLLEMNREIEVPDLSSDELRQVLDAVLYDHPEIFWLSSNHVRLSRMDEESFLLVDYIGNKEKIEDMKGRIESLASSCWADCDVEAMSNVDKVKRAHDWLLDYVSYDKGSSDDDVREKQNINSTFLDRRTVCTGYSKGLKYLLDMVNCPCIMVAGDGIQKNTKESHVWDIVKCEDSYYNIDVTWDDVYEENEHLQNLEDFHFYTYFLCDDLMFSQTHLPEDTSGRLPACNDPNGYYYRSTNHYLETDDVDVIGELFTEDILNGKPWTAVVCSDDGIYASVLKNTGEIVSRLGYLSGEDGHDVSYIAADELRMIVYEWK